MELHPLTRNISTDHQRDTKKKLATKKCYTKSIPICKSYVVTTAKEGSNTNTECFLAVEGQVTIVIFLSENGELKLVTPTATRRLPIRIGTSFIIAGNTQTHIAAWDAPNHYLQLTVDQRFFTTVVNSLNLKIDYQGTLYHFGSEADFASLAYRLTEKIRRSSLLQASLVINGIHCPAMARFIVAMMVKTRKPGAFCIEDQSPKLRLSDSRYNKVVEYVQKHLASSIHVAELASIASQSHFHFTRTFKARTGQSPHVFILERRLRRAEYLLAETHTGLAQISQECGFSSQSHFSTTFKQCVGVTPGQYRELCV